MCRSKVCVQKFWYFVSGLDIQPEQSENDNPARKNAVPETTIHVPFFYDSVVKASRGEAGDMGLIPAGC